MASVAEIIETMNSKFNAAAAAGVDLIFLELFGEFQFKQSFDDVGGAVLVKLHF